MISAGPRQPALLAPVAAGLKIVCEVGTTEAVNSELRRDRHTYEVTRQAQLFMADGGGTTGHQTTSQNVIYHISYSLQVLFK